MTESGAVQFQYDTLSRLIQRTNGSGSVRLVIDEDRVISEVSSDGSRKNLIYGDFIDDLVSIVTNTDTMMVAANHQYSIMGIYSGTGINLENYSYTPFGKMSILDPNGNEIALSALESFNVSSTIMRRCFSYQTVTY